MVAHILIKQYAVYQVLAPVLSPERFGHLEEAATSFIKQKEGEGYEKQDGRFNDVENTFLSGDSARVWDCI